MRVGSMRALALALLTVAGFALPGPAAATGPAGFSVSCTATALSDPPIRLSGVLTGTGRGRCVMTGSFGAPWVFRLTVRLQWRESGAWRTRALATSSLLGDAARKQVPLLQVGYVCTGAAAHLWRVQVIAEALANEKTVVLLDRSRDTSAAATFAC